MLQIQIPVHKLAKLSQVMISNASCVLHILEFENYGNSSDTKKAGSGAGGGGGKKPTSQAPVAKHEQLLPRLRASLALRDIVFTFPDSTEPTLKGVTMEVPSGAYVCICGGSGSGKSTLLEVLLRFREQQAGVIAVDGVDIGSCSLESFREQVGVVFQQSAFSNGTIADNIREGKLGATLTEVVEAAKKAECHEFISSLADGYDTVLGQRAVTRLSGGQLQRVALARALCRRPAILLLDEATSALDPKTEEEVVRTLIRLSKQERVSVVSVTHRLSTTLEADVIFMLQDGVVAESGTFQDLMLRGGDFAEMARVQQVAVLK
jgi:ABC-type multidrug transport system fused ATPase/permease subunit